MIRSKHGNSSNLLIIAYPDLLTEWDYARNEHDNINVNKITYGSKIKAWWLCHKCHGSYQMRVSHRTSGSGCPYCAGRKVLAGFNDLASQFPELVESEWDWFMNDKLGLKPNAIIKYSHVKTWWLCKQHGHSFEMEAYKRTLHGYGCPYCAGQKVLLGFNDLQSKYPELMKDWDYSKNKGVDPSRITYGSGLKAWWCCHECSHEWITAVNQRTGVNNTGCPACMMHHHISNHENQVADFIDDYMHSNYPEYDYTMQRSISFRRIYENMNVDIDSLSSIGSLGNDVINHLNKQLDIYIPELGLAVEYDGDYWHDDKRMLKKYGMTNSDSHMIKQELCSHVGIKLVFITEHEWLHDNDNMINKTTSMIDMMITS